MRPGWLVAIMSVLALQGCAGVTVTLFGVGAGVSASTSASHLLDSVAYKTFTTSVDNLQAATLKTLNRLDIEVEDIEVMEEATDSGKTTETGRKILAVAGNRTIEIELDGLTAKTSRMRVNAKRGWFFRDRATATEIIVQTERTLEVEPVQTQVSKASPRWERNAMKR